jgi:hypothetical protein
VEALDASQRERVEVIAEAVPFRVAGREDGDLVAAAAHLVIADVLVSEKQ